jgi:nitroimidazol reductase NimA-like FMN-containing flavoprotein (pyridoxamine 5'-phosphate oxidase superfamily)
MELEVLSRDECLRLLGKATVGRIALSRGALPTVVPVNFCVKDEQIFVRTSPKNRLATTLNGQVVAFEVDDFDPMCDSGWTVTVTGLALALTNAAGRDEVKLAPLTRWAPLGDGHVVCITAELASGYRLRESG